MGHSNNSWECGSDGHGLEHDRPAVSERSGAARGFKFRVLMNQYDEELRFTFVDDDVPNRGLSRPGAPDSDQFVVTLDYQQKIAQVAAEDRPDSSGLAGGPGLPIHHEPGLWLYEKNRRSKDDQIKRR